MNFLDLTLPDPAANVALDEALLLQAEAEAEAGPGLALLRLWEYPSPVVVLGAGGVVADDVRRDACERDGVPVLRRSSGGGTVLWGRGCLLYSLVLPYALHPALEELQPSYRWILSRILGALDLPGAGQAGISDLAVGGSKFSGTAQQRKRHHLLHHGTLLYDFDLSLVGRYLTLPPRRPDYRGDRDHDAFVCNLPRPADWLRRRLCEAWGATAPLADWPAGRVAEMVASRYGTPEWTYRR